MKKISALLEKRFANKNLDKIKQLSEESSQGDRNSFSGIFQGKELGEQETLKLQDLLNHYKNQTSAISQDLSSLSSLTAEIKIINNQAILLHGERIKKAKTILKNYKEGAFSAWLILSYGNRQTPYNFLMYYELYLSLPEKLKSIMQTMPKDALYSLGAKSGPQEEKEEIIKQYKGESKQDLLVIIRKKFPLPLKDARAQKPEKIALKLLQKALLILKSTDSTEKSEIQILEKLIKNLEKTKNAL